MIAAAEVLFSLVALGLLVFAWRYGACEAPAPHHAEMLEGEEETAGPIARRLLLVLYRSVAGLAVALAICVEMIAITVLPSAPGAAAAVLALAALAAGVPAATTMRGVERATGVRTPWRGAAAMVIAGLLGAAFAIAAAV